jgi:hypothetical protein
VSAPRPGRACAYGKPSSLLRAAGLSLEYQKTLIADHKSHNSAVRTTPWPNRLTTRTAASTRKSVWGVSVVELPSACENCREALQLVWADFD